MKCKDEGERMKAEEGQGQGQVKSREEECKK
jgi:hypothetical protein